jgi:hypothetical protein
VAHHFWLHVASYNQEPVSVLKLMWSFLAMAERRGATVIPALEFGKRKRSAWDEKYRAFAERRAAASELRQLVVRADADGDFGIHEFLSTRRLSVFTASLLAPELHRAENLAQLGKPELREILSQQRHPLTFDAVFYTEDNGGDDVASLKAETKELLAAWAQTSQVTFAMMRRLSGEHRASPAERSTEAESAVGMDWEAARQTLDKSIRCPALLWWISESHVATAGGVEALNQLGSGFSASSPMPGLHVIEAPADFSDNADGAAALLPECLQVLLPRKELLADLKLTSEYLAQFRPNFPTAPNPPTRPVR